MLDAESTRFLDSHESFHWLVFRGNQLLVTASGDFPKNSREWLSKVPLLRVMPAGQHQGRRCAVAEVAREAEAPPSLAFQHLKALLDHLPRDALALAARSLELLEFDRSHQFCGACGTRTELKRDVVVRVCANGACAREHYPRISPVVIVAIERGPEILLARSPHFPPGLYSALAGFVDAGESAEEAVLRETFEETGLRIRDPRYFGSQPWPFPHSLMLGYQAEYESGEIRCAPDEIEDAQFFHVDRLPSVFPMRYTMANLLLQDFCKRHGRAAL